MYWFFPINYLSKKKKIYHLCTHILPFYVFKLLFELYLVLEYECLFVLQTHFI